MRTTPNTNELFWKIISCVTLVLNLFSEHFFCHEAWLQLRTSGKFKDWHQSTNVHHVHLWGHKIEIVITYMRHSYRTWGPYKYIYEAWGNKRYSVACVMYLCICVWGFIYLCICVFVFANLCICVFVFEKENEDYPVACVDSASCLAFSRVVPQYHDKLNEPVIVIIVGAIFIIFIVVIRILVIISPKPVAG